MTIENEQIIKALIRGLKFIISLLNKVLKGEKDCGAFFMSATIADCKERQ